MNLTLMFSQFPVELKRHLIMCGLSPGAVATRGMGRQMVGQSPEEPTYDDYESVRNSSHELCRDDEELKGKVSDYLKEAMRI